MNENLVLGWAGTGSLGVYAHYRRGNVAVRSGWDPDPVFSIVRREKNGGNLVLALVHCQLGVHWVHAIGGLECGSGIWLYVQKTLLPRSRVIFP